MNLVTVTGGVRLDTFGFGTRDFNLPEGDTDGPRLPEHTIRAFGTALNPRVTTVLHLTSDLDASVAYGKGTRSTDAAALSDAETAPFAQSDQVEAGLKWRTADPDAWSFSAQGSYVYAFIERDQIFNPAAGRNILVGQSQRHAVLASGRATYKNTFDVLGNVGFAYATTIQQDETRPTFGERVLLPYIPQLVARLDASWRRDLGVSIDGVPMMLRTASGFTYVPGRPLPLGEYGDPFYLLNASIGVDLWHTTVRLEGRNLLGLQYRQSEFNYPSRFDRTVPLPASGAPRAERHFVAGEPLQVMVSVEVDVERMADASEEDVTAEPTSAQEE